MHNLSNSIVGPSPDAMLIYKFDCSGLGSIIGGLGGGNWRLGSSIGGHTSIGDYGGVWCILE